ncbi:unnamed protein product [Trichobilharzia szidati]|nr:unnamed protein product [Trichobilharzia szidati]
MPYMFVRPPTVRTTRNPRRRPPSVRVPLAEVSRPLLRQFVRNRRSDPRYEAYFLEVREGPAVNGNTNAAAGKSMPQPWVTVRDYFKGQYSVGLPVSICNTLLKHLLTCVVVEEEQQSDSSEDSDIASASSPLPEATQNASPTQASGDTKSPGEEATSEEASVNKKRSSRVRQKVFQLSRLKPIRIVCEATGCTLEVTARDPTAKRPSAGSEEPTQTVQADPERRWLISAPLEIRTNVSSSGEQTIDSSGIGSTTSGNGRRKHPWETRGTLELHESLMPQVSAFLADVVTRYRSVDLVPEVRSLYSASGGRRFFFDLRDTRWGKRLHISQVTELHRNVIGIPLEALVSFRSRLDMVIESLGLEDQHALRSTIFRDGENRSSRKQPRAPVSPRDASNEAGDSGDRENGTQNDVQNNRVDTNNTGNRTRGRERRRLRTGGFVMNSKVGENTETYTSESRPRRNMGNRFGRRGFWTNGGRERPIMRRNRNPRPFNRGQKTSSGENEDADVSSKSNTQSVPEPAVEPARVAPAAEATA